VKNMLTFWDGGSFQEPARLAARFWTAALLCRFRTRTPMSKRRRQRTPGRQRRRFLIRFSPVKILCYFLLCSRTTVTNRSGGRQTAANFQPQLKIGVVTILEPFGKPRRYGGASVPASRFCPSFLIFVCLSFLLSAFCFAFWVVTN
jgi:hypothetical protein